MTRTLASAVPSAPTSSRHAACCGGGAHARPASPETPPGAYVCPMHPEVVRDRPGSCPVCGMALEPTAVAPTDGPTPEEVGFKRRFVVAALFATPLALLAASEGSPWESLAGRLPVGLHGLAQLALLIPVLVAGTPLWRLAARSVRDRRPNMFTLIALGAGAATAFSLPAALGGFGRGAASHGALHFEAAGAVTTLTLLGQWIESKVRRRTRDALRDLLRRAPTVVRRVEADGRETDAPIERLAVGELFRIRPGEAAAADGVVVEGRSAVDESAFTGEPVPVAKEAGARVLAGTLNGEGTLIVRAEKVGGATALAGVAAAVAAAIRTKAPIQNTADRVAARMVPWVLAAAGATFLAWAALDPRPGLDRALAAATAVLVVACPCALGLATPLSVAAGAGRGARAGVLVRSAEALQTAASVDFIAFDKTGTLTEGRPTVVAIDVVDGFRPDEALALAASLETGSEHPLAGAVLRAAAARGVAARPLRDFMAVPGRGVVGVVDGRRVGLGSPATLAGGAAGAGPLAARLEEHLRAGRTTMTLVVDDVPAAVLATEDRLRPSARAAVADLKALGVETVLLTGDAAPAAEAVARAAGVARFEAGLAPVEKAERLAAAKAAGRVVAMAGDGVNDAPALAAADVGFALGAGADVAKRTAGFTVASDDLAALVRAIRLSRAVLRNIRQNLAFAFAYNLLALPLAAGVLALATGAPLTPAAAGAAMTASSLVVAGNALRLRSLRL